MKFGMSMHLKISFEQLYTFVYNKINNFYRLYKKFIYVEKEFFQ